MKSSVFFIGHGSPENMVEDNRYTRMWKTMKDKVEDPKAIVFISAHWVSEGTCIQSNPTPEMVYDMYGFDEELYKQEYAAKTDEKLVAKLLKLIPNSRKDNERGYDHGVYSVLMQMFPKANIPVVQISVDKNKTFQEHMEIGRILSSLRDEGVMIIGSGNIVHNLRMMQDTNPQYYNILDTFDMDIMESVLHRHEEVLLNPENLKGFEMAVPTVEHYIPLLYAYGASDAQDTTYGFNEGMIGNAFSMSSVLFES